MRLSTKGRYAARLMLELALHYGKGPMLLRDVAEREEISEKYLGQLVAPLKAAGLISSSRGAHGGYALANAPKDISLCEIVQAVEGNLALVECVHSPKICSRVNSCVTRDIWGRLSERLTEELESISLQDIVYQHRRKQSAQPLTYTI
ncbi:MAG: Rrf2 family transcriptional regulator [Candidatus Omnitrophica bacterium]|nr:Rrf2 family transcriptional regulator [Candidatus Omnitrophota bacterium]